MSRHEKRRRLKELGKLAKAVERRGLAYDAPDTEIAALVSMLDARLRTGAAAGRSSRAMALLASLQDKSNVAAPNMDSVACKAGCYFCCEVYVSAQAPRLFAIADWLRANRPDIDDEIVRLRAADEKLRGLGVEARGAANLSCPFLEDGKCGIYPVRPAACRGMFSLSLDACIASAQAEGDEIPTPAHAARLRGAYEQSLSALLHQWRLPTQHYELAHGVLVALTEPEAESRWYDGEDIFAGVGIDHADGAMTAESRRLEGEYWQALWDAAQGAAPRGHFADRFPD